MGTFHCRIEIAAGPSGPFEPLDALVDPAGRQLIPTPGYLVGARAGSAA